MPRCGRTLAGNPQKIVDGMRVQCSMARTFRGRVRNVEQQHRAKHAGDAHSARRRGTRRVLAHKKLAGRLTRRPFEPVWMNATQDKPKSVSLRIGQLDWCSTSSSDSPMLLEPKMGSLFRRVGLCRMTSYAVIGPNTKMNGRPLALGQPQFAGCRLSDNGHPIEA